MADYLPFGVGSPAEQAEVGPSFFDRLVAGIINGTVSIPKRVMDATAATAPHEVLRIKSDYPSLYQEYLAALKGGG